MIKLRRIKWTYGTNILIRKPVKEIDTLRGEGVDGRIITK
jgi:hypothetical protein